MRATVDSPKARSTRMARMAFRLTVASLSLAPGILCTGTDSPVIEDSSTAPSPSISVPSTGNPRTGPQDDHVTGHQRGDRDLFGLAIRTPQDGAFRAQGHQRLDGAAGLAHCAVFQR